MLLDLTRSRNIVRRALTLHYYFSLVLGIIALRYDFRAKRFKRAPLLKGYALFLNIAMICVLPLSLHFSLQHINFYGANQLMRLTHKFNLYIRYSVFALTILTRWRRERYAKAIIEQLVKVEAQFFDGLAVPRSIQRRFERLFIVKFLSIYFQTISAIYTFARYTPDFGSVWMLLLYFYILNVLNVLYGVMFHYFIALWYICKRFCILNVQLKVIFKKLRKHKNGHRSRSSAVRLLAKELHRLTCVHYRLTQLVVQLNDIYKYQILITQLAWILNNIATGYYSVILSGGGDDSNGRSLTIWDCFDIILGAFMFASSMADMFLMDVIYDAIAVAYQETGEVLKRFHEFDMLQVDVAQSCHLLSQHLMQQKLQISICGMFVLNKRSAFLISAATIDHVFILVQFDLERILG